MLLRQHRLFGIAKATSPGVDETPLAYEDCRYDKNLDSDDVQSARVVVRDSQKLRPGRSTVLIREVCHTITIVDRLARVDHDCSGIEYSVDAT